MKLLKKKDYDGSIRKITNDDKTVNYGLIGTVRDFIKEEVLTYCEYSPETWVYIPIDGPAVFGKTKLDVIGNIVFSE